MDMAAGLKTETSSVGPKLAFDPDLMATVGAVAFTFFQVCTPFNPETAFSEVRLKLLPHTNIQGNNIVVAAKHLFALHSLEHKPQYAQVFKFVKTLATTLSESKSTGMGGFDDSLPTDFLSSF